MNERILFVDDEQNVLDGIRRQLRKRFELQTACGAEAGLRELEVSGPYPVVVSDMRMPNMNGAEFLAEARKRFPDGVRMILSGQAELGSAIEAVNEGNIFRFLTKPCSTEVLMTALESALKQYRLVVAERELLEQTLSGSVKVLTEILCLLSPKAFSKSLRIKHYVDHVAAPLPIAEAWQLRLAAMLWEIGCVSLPAETLHKLEQGEPVTEEERKLIRNHPDFARQLIGKIPRLETVARIVARQREHIHASELPTNPMEWDIETLGVQLLGMCRRYDELLCGGTAQREALRKLRAAGFSPTLVDLLASAPNPQSQHIVRSLGVLEMRVSMILDQDVRTVSGLLLLPKGHELTETMLARLRSFKDGVGVEEPCRVLVSSSMN